MWAVFALGAAFLTSFNPILYKRMLRAAEPMTVVWAVTLLSLPLLGFFVLSLGPGIPHFDWVFVGSILGSAALDSIAQLASTRALELADASRVTPLLTFAPLFTLVVSAVFLGEIPSWRGLLGAGFVLVGAYWLNRVPSDRWLAPFKAVVLQPGVGLVLLAGLLWAITPLFEKTAILHTSPEDPRFTAFCATLALAVLLTPLVAAQRASPVVQLASHRREFVLAGLIAGVAPVLGYTAYSLGLVGYVTTVFKISALMTVLWSSWLLKEPSAAQRLPASALMVVGTILMAL